MAPCFSSQITFLWLAAAAIAAIAAIAALLKRPGGVKGCIDFWEPGYKTGSLTFHNSI